MGTVIGIDLGTSNSCVAIARGGKVEVLPNAYGEHVTASVVAFDEEGYFSGAGPTAEAAWVSALQAEVLAIKGDDSGQIPHSGPAFDAEVVARASRHHLAQVSFVRANLPSFVNALGLVEDRLLRLIEAAVRKDRKS